MHGSSPSRGLGWQTGISLHQSREVVLQSNSRKSAFAVLIFFSFKPSMQHESLILIVLLGTIVCWNQRTINISIAQLKKKPGLCIHISRNYHFVLFQSPFSYLSVSCYHAHLLLKFVVRFQENKAVLIYLWKLICHQLHSDRISFQYFTAGLLEIFTVNMQLIISLTLQHPRRRRTRAIIPISTARIISVNRSKALYNSSKPNCFC